MPHFDSCGHRKAVRSDVCTASDAMRAIYTVLLCNFISGGCADVGKLCASHLVNRGRIMTPVSDGTAGSQQFFREKNAFKTEIFWFS